MSTNQELVLRAEQAAQQVAQDKADIQAMVTKLEQVQAPAIASAKENIKQALIEKGQTVDDSVPFSEYGNKVRAISSGQNTSDATATENDILSGKTAYGANGKITGNIETVTATSSGNVVTVNKGYHAEQKKITVGTSKGATTITPGTTNQTVASGTYLSGKLTVKGDSNLTSGNIKEGVSIFGVEGSFAGSGGGTTGGGEDFYRCAEVFGTNVIKYLKVSNAIDEVNGDYEETGIIKNGEPVYSKVSPNANSHYIYYVESDWDSGWVINNNMNENSLEYSLYYAGGLIGGWSAGEPLGWEGGANTSFYHAIINQGQTKTWSGYKLTLTENGYLEDSTLTTGLLYGVGDTSDYVTNSIVPKKNKIYNSSCTIELEDIKIADNFITFTAEEPFSKVKVVSYNSNTDMSGLKYSLDGKTWLSYQDNFEIILYNVGDYVKFKDTNPNRTKNLGQFNLSGKIACTGELNSLVNGKLDWHENCFDGLFRNQSSLTTAPSITFNTLDYNALGMAFCDCKKLKRIRFNVKGSSNGYRGMQQVLQGCDNLSVIEVDFKSWDNEQTDYWCNGVSSTGVFVKPSELPLEYGISRIPEGWTVINK